MADLKPIYLIYGDSFQTEQALTRLKKRIASGTSNMNVKEFSAAVDKPEAVLQAADSLPFLGEHHLIVVRDFDKASADDARRYIAYAGNPSPTTVLVLMAEKANKASPIFKAVSAGGQVHEFKTLKDSELFVWVERRFEARGKKAGPHSVRYLVEQVGTDMRTLDSEIEKVSVYAADQVRIEPEDLARIVSRNPQNTVFELVDALGTKDSEEALIVLNRLFTAGEPPLKVLGMIVRQFRLILKTKALESSRASRAELAKELGVPPFVVDKYRKQSDRFSIDEIKRVYELLMQTDIAIKMGEMRADTALEVLIGKMFGARGAEAHKRRSAEGPTLI